MTYESDRDVINDLERDDSGQWANMVDFSIPHASKSEVVRAGKVLGGPTIWTPEAHEEYVKTFRTAYDWRNSHQFPMQRIRQELTGKVRRLKLHGITAARTKRMSSIRKKLKRSTITLAQIQDLGGCRAIVDSCQRRLNIPQKWRLEIPHFVALGVRV
jgi:hypothetical protein